MIPVDVTGASEDSIDIDFGGQSRDEVRARHNPSERFTRALARNEVEQREPILDEWDPKQRYTSIKTVWDSVARENVLDHLAIGFDVADHDGNLVWAFPAV